MLLFIYAWGGRSRGLAIFLQSRSYEVYQAILCNNCKYSFNILGTVNNVFIISNIVLRCFFPFYIFSFLWWEKLRFTLADIVEEFSQNRVLRNSKE